MSSLLGVRLESSLFSAHDGVLVWPWQAGFH